ncbi:MAG: hypothetical protein AB7N76_09400 [Planctomycetota bacterium]
MKASYIAFAAGLLALSSVTAGCLEGAQDFEVHGDGSGVVSMGMKLGAEFSEMVAKSFEGKKPEQLDLEAFGKVSEDFEGVYWEEATQRIVDGKVVIKARGVFPDVRKVKQLKTKTELVEGELKKVKQENLLFTFEQNDSGGKLSLKMDSGEKKKKDKEPEGPEAEMMKKQMEKMFEKMFKDLKFRVSVRPPGKISKNGLMDLGDNRAGFEFTLAMLKDKALTEGRTVIDGEVTWEGKTAAPSGFAERLEKAKKHHAELKKQAEAAEKASEKEDHEEMPDDDGD